jgi:hypothetical protein
MTERCGIHICSGIILIITLSISLLMYYTGCIKGMCPNYIHANGVITGFYYTTNNKMLDIYANLITDQNINCTTKIYSKKFNIPNINSTTIYDYTIGNEYNTYIIKENQERCIIDNDGKLYLNGITGAIMFGLFGLLVLLIISCMVPIQVDELSYSTKMFIRKYYSERPRSPKINPIENV